MGFLKRIGIDSYMLMLLGTVMVGLVLPARGVAADALGQVTYWAVALLFFLYGAKLDPASVKAGMLNWRLQGLTFAATYLMIPVLGMAFALIFGDLLGPQVTLGLVFLAVLPSTIQSSIAFVSMAGGNVPAAICAASLSNLVGVALTPALSIPPTALIALIAVMLVLLACVFGMMAGAGRAFGLPLEDRIVLFFCGSTKSLATGLPIATALFPAETVGATVLPVLVYHMAQLLICAMIAQNRARRNATALVA